VPVHTIQYIHSEKKTCKTYISAAELVEHPGRRRIKALQVLFGSSGLDKKVSTTTSTSPQRIHPFPPLKDGFMGHNRLLGSTGMDWTDHVGLWGAGRGVLTRWREAAEFLDAWLWLCEMSHT
jgi:hypothetical protein